MRKRTLASRRYTSSDAYPFRTDADGKPLCRFCGECVKPPRRSWCSQECVDKFLASSSGSALRSQTFQRDQGVCAECGCDTEKLKRVIGHVHGSLHDLERYDLIDGAIVGVRAILRKLGFNPEQSTYAA